VTSIAVLASVDQRGPSAIYLLSDSRLTWDGGKKGVWDCGRKTFSSRNTPDVFAFYGEALFPAMVLPQIVDLLDAQFAVPKGASFEGRFSALHKFASLAFRSYPDVSLGVTILHAGRDGSGIASKFRIGILASSTKADGWHRKLVDAPLNESGLSLPQGSGALAIRRAITTWRAGPAAKTSRGAFSAFVQALKSRQDPSSGGPPQMVGVYRTGNGHRFGMIWEGRGYLAGLPVGHQQADSMDVEWRNEAFERVSVVTRRRLPHAQRHADISTQ
jgi:hypothetical protein